jgi:integrase
MKTKSQFIKNWVKKGGNLKGDEWNLVPVKKSKFSSKDIQNLQADEVNIIAVIGSQRDGRRVKLGTVADLEQQESKQLWLHQKIEEAKTKLFAPVPKQRAAAEDHKLDTLLRKTLVGHYVKEGLACTSVVENSYFPFWSKHLGQVEINKITAAHVANLRDKLLETDADPRYSRSDSGKLSHSTVRNYLSALSKAFEFGALPEVGFVKGANPVRQIRWPDLKGKNANKREAILIQNSDQLKILLECVSESQSPDLSDIFFFCLEVGIRASEAYGLTWDNFDSDQNTLKIEKALRSNVPTGEFDHKNGKAIYHTNELGGRRVITKGLKNNEDSRSFDLEGCDIALEILRKRRAAAAEKQLATGIIENRIFPAKIEKSWNRVVKCAGLRGTDLPELKKICFHTLRHTCASWQIQSGEVSLYEIQHRQGWKCSQSVQRYAHYDPKLGRRGSSVVSGALKAAISQAS